MAPDYELLSAVKKPHLLHFFEELLYVAMFELAKVTVEWLRPPTANL